MDKKKGYKGGDETFDRVFVNALNGVDPETLSAAEILIHEEWIEENWEDLNSEE